MLELWKFLYFFVNKLFIDIWNGCFFFRPIVVVMFSMQFVQFELGTPVFLKCASILICQTNNLYITSSLNWLYSTVCLARSIITGLCYMNFNSSLCFFFLSFLRFCFSCLHIFCLSKSEFSGSTFSSNGKFLFSKWYVTIKGEGLIKLLLLNKYVKNSKNIKRCTCYLWTLNKPSTQ